MAALDRVQTAGTLGVSAETVRRIAATAIWQWYTEHRDDVILKKGIGPFSITIKLHHLTFLIERITGTPRPA